MFCIAKSEYVTPILYSPPLISTYALKLIIWGSTHPPLDHLHPLLTLSYMHCLVMERSLSLASVSASRAWSSSFFSLYAS